MTGGRFLSLGMALVFLVAAWGCSDEGTQPVVQTTVASLLAINDNQSVTLGWTEWVEGVPATAEIHRSTTPTFTPSSGTWYATIDGSETQFVDQNVTNGVMYYYRIVPVDIQGSGEGSRGIPSNVAI